jgi:hypothetical protein
MLILFGGGDGGGFYVGPDGKVHTIPPFDPEAKALLVGVNQFLQAVRLIPGLKIGEELQHVVSTSLSNALSRIGKTAGGVIIDGSPLVFIGDDGGYCGTIAPHQLLPRPFPPPPPAFAASRFAAIAR